MTNFHEVLLKLKRVCDPFDRGFVTFCSGNAYQLEAMEKLEKSANGMKFKVHGAQTLGHIMEIGKVAKTQFRE